MKKLKTTLRDEIIKVLDEFNVERVPVFTIMVSDEIFQINRYELTALQVLIARMTDEEYENFNRTVKVYDGRLDHSNQVQFSKDGRLVIPLNQKNDDELYMELLRLKARIPTNQN